MKRINRPRRKGTSRHYALVCRTELSAQPPGRHARNRAILRAALRTDPYGAHRALLHPPRPGPVYRRRLRQTKGPAHYRAQAAR